MAVTRNLMVRAVADFSDLNKKMKATSNQLNSFGKSVKGAGSMMTGALKGIGATVGVAVGALTALVLALKQPVEDAMQYEVAFNQVERTMGKSAQSFVDWSETSAQALGYSQLQAMKTASTYSTLFQTFTNDQQELADRTKEMMKATAVVMSTTGRTMDDTFERIRSGVLGNTEAIEDLGVSVGETTLKNSESFKKMAQGKSWDQLSEKIKQNIRYQEILNQVTAKYGSEVVDSTATRLRVFQAALGDVRLALGQAFLPILNIALPYLTALANKLAVVMRYFAAFMRVFFKKGDIQATTKQMQKQNNTYGNQATAVNNVSKAVKNLTKAQKENKRGVASFDEVNLLNDPTSETGSTTGGDTDGGGNLPSTDSGPFNDFLQQTGQAQTQVDRLREKVQDWVDNAKTFFKPLDGVWQNFKDGISDVWDGLVNLWNTPFIQNMVDGIISSSMSIFAAICDTVSNSLSVIGDSFNIVADILNGDWGKAWDDTKKLISDFYDIFQDICVDLFPEFSDQIKQGKQDWVDVFDEMGKQFTKVWNAIKDFKWDDVKKSVQDFWTNTIVPWFKTDVVGKIKEAFTGKDGVSGGTLMTNLKNGWGDIKQWFLDVPVANVKAAFANISGGTLMTNLKSGWGDIKKWWTDTVNPKIKDALSQVNGSTIMGYLKGKWGDVKKWFTDNIANKIKSAFSTVTSGIGGTITNAFKIVYNKAVGYINDVIDMINKVGDTIDSKLPGNQIKHIDHIPKLAQGGITGKNSPFLAMVGDNKTQREVVSPLDDLMGMISTAVTSAMAFNNNNRGGQQLGGDIVLNVDGKQFARITKPYLDQEQLRIGANVRLNTI